MSLDVDGILLDFVTPFLAIINRIGGTSFEPRDVTSWDITKALKLSRDVEEAAYLEAHTKGFCHNLPVLPGAKEGVKWLEERFDLFYVTSPMEGDYWMPERHRALKGHFGAKSKQIAQVSAKFITTGDILVDDKFENLDLWAKEFDHHNAVLWDTLHNRRDPNIYGRIKGWDELKTYLEGFLTHRGG